MPEADFIKGVIIMKKYVRLIVAAVMILTLVTVFAVCASAVEPTNEGGHWVINAEKIDEILAGEAGEKTTGWEVPFLQVSPVLDGTINKAEYMDFELYEDYMSYMAMATGNTKEKFMEFYEMTKDGNFDAYWGWDGVYLYLAMEVRCVNGFHCTPEDMGGPSYLYAYNMFQVGIAPKDAVGKHPDYVELGYGVNSNTGESIAHAWAGPYYPEAGEGKDFVGSYSQENQTVTYEVRIHLQKALGLKDTVVENGDQINFGWLISVNGETSSVNDYWQIGFCHGIGGQYSNKQNQYLALVTFTGKDKVITPEEIEGVSPEDKEYGLAEFVDFSKEDVVKTFTGENAAIDFTTENGESFARITALGDMPYVWSKTYPRALQSAEVFFVVVKYRTSSAQAEELGMIYRNAYFPDYDLENMYYETVGTDGEWHTVIFYMEGEERWQNWIVNMGLAPFANQEEPAGQTIDIAFVKFYKQDPYELYEDSEYDPNAEETTAAETEPVTEPAVDTEAATQASTQAVTQDPASNETEPVDESGCASAVSVGAVAVLAVAAVVALKKKED